MISKAVILIPDISGYTEFVSKTELSHSTHIVNELFEALLKENNNEFSLAEIEGDALLLYKEDGQPAVEGLIDLCKRMFKAFHLFLREVERDRVCMCGACKNAINLSLKFVLHFGEITRMQIGSFSKPTGIELIIAHRLLKNSLKTHSYMLCSDSLIKAASDSDKVFDGGWKEGFDTYEAIGEVNYHFLDLNSILDELPPLEEKEGLDYTIIPPLKQNNINTSLKWIYATLINHRAKPLWVKGVKEIIVEDVIEREGSKHLCILEGITIDFETIRSDQHVDKVIHIEKGYVREMDLEFLNYYELHPVDNDKTIVKGGLAALPGASYPEEFVKIIQDGKEVDLASLKEYCEGTYETFRMMSGA